MSALRSPTPQHISPTDKMVKKSMAPTDTKLQVTLKYLNIPNQRSTQFGSYISWVRSAL